MTNASISMLRGISLTIAAAFTLGAHAAAPASSAKDISTSALTPAVKEYLRKKGDFCLGKFDWPIAVSDADRETGTNDALQMPVLAGLGLVAPRVDPNNPTIQHYDLTARGRKYYLVKKTITLGPGNVPVEHPGDFCVAKLTLDKVVSWQPPEKVSGSTRVTVKYTYKVATAAPWARDPGIQQVFPMIPRIIDGAGKMQMMQVLAWKGRSWVAVMPGD
jgi:hypothetical protein